MSQFSGSQGKGAMKKRRIQKRVQAAERDAHGAVAIVTEIMGDPNTPDAIEVLSTFGEEVNYRRQRYGKDSKK